MSDNNIVATENQTTPTLLHETNPSLILDEAKDIANALADIIKEKKLYKKIGAKEHVYVEGWTTLGALLKVFPILESSVRLDREDEIIYESKVVAKTLQGEIIGVGEAVCSNKEKNWLYSDEYAIKSMSITRATSKALRIPLGWIMTLAGYSGTPFEEMTSEMGNTSNNSSKKPAPAQNGRKQAPAKKPAKPSVPRDINPDTVEDAEVTPKLDFKALSKKSKAFKKVCDVLSNGGFDLDEHTIYVEANTMNTNGKLTDKELDEIEVLLGKKPA